MTLVMRADEGKQRVKDMMEYESQAGTGIARRKEKSGRKRRRVKILLQIGCRIVGKWTPSHQGIAGNERADTVAKEGLFSTPCHWTRATLSWAKYQPRQLMKTANSEGRPQKFNNTPFLPTRGLPKRVRKVITSNEDMMDADYELGADI